MEQKKWIFNVELIRASILAGIVWPYCNESGIIITLLFISITVLILFYRSLQNVYLSTVYKPI